MPRIVTRLILVLALVLAAAQAQAACRDDIATLTARLQTANAKAPNVGAAKKELAKAEDNRKDEIECDNAVARAWRALRKPPPAPLADDARK